jgi:hypothetical protein
MAPSASLTRWAAPTIDPDDPALTGGKGEEDGTTPDPSSKSDHQEAAVRVDRRVSPNQIGLWTIAELIAPRRTETPNAHPIRQLRVGVAGLEVVIRRTKIRPRPGRQTSGNGENGRELPRCDFAGQSPIRRSSPTSLRVRLITTSSDNRTRLSDGRRSCHGSRVKSGTWHGRTTVK